MDTIVPIDFDQLLAAVRQSINKSGGIRDKIQKTENTMYGKYYNATLELEGDVIVAKFKEPKKLSRIYKIANQKDVDKVVSIFYVRYLLYRQFIDVDMYALTKAFVERRRNYHGLQEDSNAPIEVVLPPCNLKVLSDLSTGDYEVCTSRTDTAKIKPGTHLYDLYSTPCMVDAVAHMVGFLINNALTNEQAEHAEQAINSAIIAGHQFLVGEEFIDVE